MLRIGSWAEHRGQAGVVRYIGPLHFDDGEWVGLELQVAAGKNDGMVRGKRYFTCPPQHGLFVQASQLVPISQPKKPNAPQREGPDTQVASAWSAVENVLEGEALSSAREGARVVRHLEQRYPQPQPPDRQQLRMGGRRSNGRVKSRLTQQDGDLAYQELLQDSPLPQGYAGPPFEKRPTNSMMAALLAHIKRAVVDRETPVPQRVAIQILLWTKEMLLEFGDQNIVDLQLKKGRLVVVGDTHGQLADFCWLLRSHGTPSPENIYLINGDVADRGGNAVEILLLVFGYMLVNRKTMFMNRGNHESLDMNVRGFHEGGGFAEEVGAKYDPLTFNLFQDVFNLLPLSTRINDEVLVVHGGLCRTSASTLDQIRAINRKRPIPCAPQNAEDVLFFDLMWADPRGNEGVGLSAVRGSGCCTFGPDVTRRFCEMNRLRMVIRSHEVPKTLSGVQVQHNGRLITIFSASNYCGRIGNTGGTMLLTPQLDYQLMEHWAPSIAELLQMEAEEGLQPPLSSEDSSFKEKRMSFSGEAETLMRADVIQKMKELVSEHKVGLNNFYVQNDPSNIGVVSGEVCLQGLREVVKTPLPWEDFLEELAGPSTEGKFQYKAFLRRYRIGHEDDRWQAEVFAQLHDALCKRDLNDTLAFFDTNQDGVVTYDELLQVLQKFSIGVPDDQLQALTKDLLRGKSELQTASLISHFQVQYCGLSAVAKSERAPPEWAKQLLDTVSRQCAMRKRDSLQLFRSFDSNGDGFISYDEFQKAMMRLGGYLGSDIGSAQRARIEQMLLDLAQWIDSGGTGTIPYIEFIEAFRLVDSPGVDAAGNVAAQADTGTRSFIAELMEHLCLVFFQNRWSLKYAFEYFDANGDGVLSQQEFKTALEALRTLPAADSAKTQPNDSNLLLELTDEQVSRLVRALDRDGDGFIDYDEFLKALETRDVLEP